MDTITLATGYVVESAPRWSLDAALRTMVTTLSKRELDALERYWCEGWR